MKSKIKKLIQQIQRKYEKHGTNQFTFDKVQDKFDGWLNEPFKANEMIYYGQIDALPAAEIDHRTTTIFYAKTDS